MRSYLLLAVALAGCRDKSPPTPAPAASAAAPAVSALAPDTVSAATEVAYDAGPSVLGGEQVDGAALRKRHVERLKQDKSAVTVLRGKTPRELGETICERVMPRRPKATPILLKPNLCGFDGIVDPAKRKGDDGMVGRTTDVGFTRGVVQCLKKRGHTAITIAEGCGISHEHWKRVAALTGYESMAKEEGVKLVAMDDDGVYDVEGDRPGLPLRIKGIANSRVPTLLMPKILAEHLDHGLFVSLPKVKAHRFSVTSMAIKGMQGTVMLSDALPAYRQKFRTHRELNEQIKAKKAAKAADAAPPDPAEARRAHVAALLAFAERMADVLEISTPDVVLAEAAPAMGGDGFWQLYPSEELVAIGGTNPVSVDGVGAELLGLSDNARLANELGGHRTSPLITVAAKRYGLDLKTVPIEGDAAGLLSKPRAFHFRSMAGFEVHSSPETPWSPVARSAPPPVVVAARELHAASVESDSMVIDGKGDDAVWARARAVNWDTDWSGAPTGISTRARFAWSKAGLFALFELEGAGLHVDRARPVNQERDKLYQEDCVEIFLGHDAANPKHYAEIEIGPFGHWFDLDVRPGASDVGWSSGLVIGTTRDASARRATIEAKIAAKEMVALLRPGARIPLGLYRMEGAAPRKYLAWSPTLTRKPNFHVPDRFGVLVVD